MNDTSVNFLGPTLQKDNKHNDKHNVAFDFQIKHQCEVIGTQGWLNLQSVVAPAY